ncbi:FliM/FliN family flagellar motor switch protein [Poseidonocella sedimentorum]|uniref:Flagellar motor switch protein FliN n=1 Tax=Poseidonocella sedimentorum TaxID=871652 RepID=A0A1I6D606_9RHOB|nr:FliM/FliN family flagellar motor switch protein [Poseidonocella sedimentorum]SFR00757.1 flagellar motor switch protein FliN/FliY [Poseidonocella sedimentorum]
MSDAQTETLDPANPFSNVPIDLMVSVGRAKPRVRELLEISENAVLKLDRRVEDPVELFVGDRLVARGELEELEGEQQGQLAIRITEIVDLKQGL